MRGWVSEHLDVVAATWLIGLVFAWSVFLAYQSSKSPANWDGPLVGGVDWYSTVVSPPADSQGAGPVSVTP